MASQPSRIKLKDVSAIIAVVPQLLGFHPDNSIVVIGLDREHHQVSLVFRYDLPDPPGQAAAAAIAGHAIPILLRDQLATAVFIGYGPGTLVSPVIDVLRLALPTRIRLHDALRVDQGRYWSYLCGDPSCCPADGVPVPEPTHPASLDLHLAGRAAAVSRDALAATIASADGLAAEAMTSATAAAEQAAESDLDRHGAEARHERDLATIKDAITTYRDGGTITDHAIHAAILVALTRIEIRDNTWARMDPQYREAHTRMCADLTRLARPGYVAAPASLLAFTAWQTGDGVLANLAIERALAEDPEYPMAMLIRDALHAGISPARAVVPVTPDEVDAAYADLRHSE